MELMWVAIIFGVGMMWDSSFLLGMSFVLSIKVVMDSMKESYNK